MKTKLALALVALSPTLAFAADRSDIRALEETKITLVEAIHAAEKDRNGRALDAGIDDDSFRPAYEVSVVADGRIWDVQVDGVTGKINGAREDIDD